MIVQKHFPYNEHNSTKEQHYWHKEKPCKAWIWICGPHKILQWLTPNTFSATGKGAPWADLMVLWRLPSSRPRDRENWESHYCTQKQHINVKYKSDSTAYITSVITFTPNFITKLKLETSSILACSFRAQSKPHVTWGTLGKIPDCQQHDLICLYSYIFLLQT